MILQMAVKAVNNSAGSNEIVPILFIFGVYPQFTEMDSPSPSVTKRIKVICAATKEVCCLYAEK